VAAAVVVPVVAATVVVAIVVVVAVVVPSRAVSATIVVAVVVVATWMVASYVSAWMSARMSSVVSSRMSIWVITDSSGVRTVDGPVVVSVDVVVSSSVNTESVRTGAIEVIAVSIASVDWVVPSAASPCQRAIEVVEPNVDTILIVGENIAKVCVAAAPPCAVKVTVVVDAEQIVQVHLVGQFILLFGQVEFVCHLVGEEEGLTLCFVDWQGVHRQRRCEKHGHE